MALDGFRRGVWDVRLADIREELGPGSRRFLDAGPIKRPAVRVRPDPLHSGSLLAGGLAAYGGGIDLSVAGANNPKVLW